MQVYCRPFLNYAVGLFLFLSGLLSQYDRINQIKRINKVVVPYVLWTFVYTVSDGTDNIVIRFIKSLLLGDSAVHMYYVFVYCQFMLLLPIIHKIAKSKYCMVAFVITPLEIMIMRYIPIHFEITFNQYICKVISISCLGWFTFFYLGYLIGNNLISIDIKMFCVILMLCISIPIQMYEGYIQYNMGVENCGTQLKISAVLSSVLFCVFGYKYIIDDKKIFKNKILKILGDNSFGIYFSHIAVMGVMSKISGCISEIYPFNALCVIVSSLVCVLIGKKILGRLSRYVAL